MSCMVDERRTSTRAVTVTSSQLVKEPADGSSDFPAKLGDVVLFSMSWLPSSCEAGLGTISELKPSLTIHVVTQQGRAASIAQIAN